MVKELACCLIHFSVCSAEFFGTANALLSLQQGLLMSGSFSRRWMSESYSSSSDSVDSNSEEPDLVRSEREGYSTTYQEVTAAETMSTPLLSRHRSVQMITPLHYQPGYQYPLLVWLHSSGHNERQIEQVLPHISTRNYVGVGVRATRATDVRGCGFDWPMGPDAASKACDDVFSAIDEAMTAYTIHPERVILAGYGSGATLACRIAMMQCDRIAGVVRMGGQFADNCGAMKNFKNLRQRRLPMLWLQAINEVDDELLALQRDISVAQLIRSQVEIRQYMGDDVMNTAALKDIDRWCFDKIIAPKPEPAIVGEAILDEADRVKVDFSAN